MQPRSAAPTQNPWYLQGVSMAMLPRSPPRDPAWMPGHGAVGLQGGQLSTTIPSIRFCSHPWPILAPSSGILTPELTWSLGGRGERALTPSANPLKEMREPSPNAQQCWLWFPAGETEAGSEGKPLPGNLLPGLHAGRATTNSETQRSHVPLAHTSSSGTLRCSAPPESRLPAQELSLRIRSQDHLWSQDHRPQLCKHSNPH